MRYLLVTYDETELPAPGYDLYDKVMTFLQDEGVDCALADLHAPSGVEEHLYQQQMAAGGSPTQQLLLTIRDHIEYAQDEMLGIPVVTEEAREYVSSVHDELAAVVTLVDDALSPAYVEVDRA